MTHNPYLGEWVRSGGLPPRAMSRWDGVPAMFAFSDPDGNVLVYFEDQA